MLRSFSDGVSMNTFDKITPIPKQMHKFMNKRNENIKFVCVCSRHTKKYGYICYES